MNRRAKKGFIIFGIIAVVLIIAGGFFYNFQKNLRDDYVNLKNGKTAWAEVYQLENEDYSNPDLSKKYIYVFNFDGQDFAAVTVYGYKADQIESVKKDGKIFVRYLVKNSKVVLDGSIKIELNGKNYPLALSREDEYFVHSDAPSMAATYFVCVIALFFLAMTCLNFGKLMFYKSIENKGEFTYAVFDEAYSSKFGTSRYMAIRYKYKTADERWVETVSPYAFTAMQVDLLKNMEAFGVKYKGRHSIITESLRSSPNIKM